MQFGLVRIDLGVCPEPVRRAIVEGKTPLGRILIQHDMLRRIEPTAFLKVKLNAAMADWFGVAAGTLSYGRLGVIYTGDRPPWKCSKSWPPFSRMHIHETGVLRRGL